jgi:hypothetical protein
MALAMISLRLVSLPVHAVLELLGGLALMAAPFVLGFGPGGLVASVAVGAVVVGLALLASGGHEGLAVSAHFALDRGVAVGLLGGALVLGLAGDDLAATVLAVAAAAQTALNVSTRYSAPA